MELSIGLDELTVMQDALRHSCIDEMIDFVAGGGFWTKDVLSDYAANSQLTRVCPLMEIVRFEDGRYMIHDGHHRVVATWLGGRDYLRGDEFILKHWKYSNYQNINFVNHWITPFDPRNEVRAADISAFKKHVFSIMEEDPEEAEKFIIDNRFLYVRPRLFTGVADLIDKYLWHSYEGEINEVRSESQFY